MTATLAPEAAPTRAASGRVWACYCRLSLAKGDGRGTSLAITRQCEENAAYVERQDPGARIVHFHDDGKSGYSLTTVRDEFNAALAAIEAGEIGALVAWHADRISRNVEVTARVLRICRTNRVELHTTLGGQVADEMALQIASVVAEAESRQKANRMVSKHRQLREAGAFSGGRRRFGYDKTMTHVIEAEAALIREMANRALVGESLRSIAAWLNAAGVPTASGKVHSSIGPILETGWRPGMVRGILTGQHLTGRRENAGTLVKATWDRILEPATFDALALRFTTDPEKPTHSRKAAYLLTGIAQCGRPGCGGAMGGRAVKRHAENGAVYWCRVCQRVQRKAAPIDEMVTEYVLARLEQMDAAGYLVSDDDAQAMAALVAERDEIGPTRDNLAALLAAGKMTAEGYAAAESALGKRAEEIGRTLAALREQTEAPSRALEGATGPDARRTWEAWTNDPSGNGLARQRAIVALLLRVVILPSPTTGRAPFDPASVEITYRELG